MLDQGIRQAILELHHRGQGVRAIARALAISRAAVRDVLRRGSAEVPRLARAEKALEHRENIVRLLQECEGSLMRVHEELTKTGFPLSYPALTAFGRRHGIGQVPKQLAGRYDFAPGQEMQHDTMYRADQKQIHIGNETLVAHHYRRADRFRSASRLHGPAPAAAKYNHVKQKNTAGSPRLRSGQNPRGI